MIAVSFEGNGEKESRPVVGRLSLFAFIKNQPLEMFANAADTRAIGTR